MTDGLRSMMLPDVPTTEAAVVDMTNAFRVENRLAPVRRNALLTAAAKAYAAYLARTAKFAHEADGRQPWDRTQAAGYKHCSISENLALNQDSRGFETQQLARDAVEGWKSSPPHRAAMLGAAVTEIGVGIAQAPDRDAKFISVQLFGRPASLRYEFKIENWTDAPLRYGFASKTHDVPANGWVTHASCEPGRIVFQALGKPQSYDAAPGAIYAVRRASGGDLRVDMNIEAAKASAAPSTTAKSAR
jgi:Cysteine-rich secretory protein family